MGRAMVAALAGAAVLACAGQAGAAKVIVNQTVTPIWTSPGDPGPRPRGYIDISFDPVTLGEGDELVLQLTTTEPSPPLPISWGDPIFMWFMPEVTSAAVRSPWYDQWLTTDGHLTLALGRYGWPTGTATMTVTEEAVRSWPTATTVGDSFTFSSGRIRIADPDPEPATWALMVLGLTGIGVALRRPRERADRISHASRIS